DELFLAQKIRRIVPDVQLFLMESELLFSHTSIADEMRGALVVSRYPLFNLNQIWSSPRQVTPRVQFATGSSQGVYNAAILQLLKFDKEREAKLDAIARAKQKSDAATTISILSRSNFAGPQDAAVDTPSSPEKNEWRNPEWPKPLEYGEPFKLNSLRPPLWVGMVGHWGIWPIGTLGPSGSLNKERTPEWKEAPESKERWNKAERDWKERWKKAEQYTAEFESKDEPIPLISPS